MNKFSIKRIILIAIIVMIVTVLGFALVNGSFTKKSYQTIWSSDYLKDLSIRDKMIANGIKASTSHNLQPWLIKYVDEDSIELYADMSKDLKIVDKDHKQMLISQGSFIESYNQMAAALGYKLNVSLHEADFSKDLPHIASLRIEKSNESIDTVSGSSFSPGDGNKDLAKLQVKLEEINNKYSGLEFEIYEDPLDLEELQKWLIAGNEIESTHQEAMEELLDVFRFTEFDKSEYRYGLTLSHLNSFEAMFVQPIMKYSNVSWESFGQSSISEFSKRMDKEFAYIFIRGQEDSSETYINVGRAYQQLITSGTGLSIRPHIQLLESYGDLEAYGIEFQRRYKAESGKILMILGIQEASTKALSATPRHLLEDIIIQ